MVSLSLSSVAIVVLAGLVAGLAAKWLFQKDTEKENRRRAAIHMSGTLREHGLTETSKFIESYAVGDYSGMGYQIKQLSELFLKGEVAVMQEFGKVFDRLLKAKLASPEGRVMVAALLQDAADKADPSVVANAPAPSIAPSK